MTICWMNGETLSSTRPLRQHADQQRADHRADDAADAAEQRGAADHHRGDHVELEPEPGHRLGRIQPRREEEGPPSPQKKPTIDVDQEHDRCVLTPLRSAAGRVAADGVDVLPEARYSAAPHAR